jgi:hypothetical protein
MDLEERRQRGNWRNQLAMATIRYGYLTTVQSAVAEGTSLAPIEGLINKNISLKSFSESMV